MSKETIRKELIDVRKSIVDKKDRSNKIFEALMDLDEYKDANNILIYHSLPEEVDTTGFLGKKIHRIQKNIFLPICRKEEDYEIKPSRYSEGSDLIKGDLGVMQPSEQVGFDDIDLVIVPGIGFDISGNRIGFGKGCYDRYLSKNRNAKRIGISFDETLVDSIPAELHDMRMEMIITEKRVIRCS